MGVCDLGRQKKMENKNELLCAYASLILADGDQDVTADNINAILKAAGASVPAYYSALFEKVNGLTSVKSLVENAGNVGGGGGGGGAAPAAAGGAAPAAAAAVEEEEMAAGGGLFGEEGDDY